MSNKINKWSAIIGSSGRLRIEYIADSSAFNAEELYSETEEEIASLMDANIDYESIPENDFVSRARYLVQHDINRLIGGIVKRLAKLDFMNKTPQLWGNYISASESSWESAPAVGDVAAEKFGIKVFRLVAPVDLDSQ